MRAGTLRHRVRIQTPPTTTGTRGEIIGSATDFTSRYCSIDTLTGDELIQAKQQFAKATHKIVMRYVSGLTETHSIIFGNRTFGIRSINNVEEKNETMEIIVSEEK